MSRGMESSAMEALEECRKALARAKVDQLQDGQLLLQGVDLVLRSYPVEMDVKHLELVGVLLRQLNSLLFSSSIICDESLLPTVTDKLVPAFQPSGQLASLILNNLEHPLKVQQQRATEALSAAGQLSILLPSSTASTSRAQPETFIIPLFRQAVSGGISRRSNLTVISTLLECIPLPAVPESLIENLLGDLGVVDCANIRSTLINNLLIKLSATQPEDEGKSWVVQKLIPYFDPELPHTTMVNMNRYLLPSLFKTDPSYITIFLKSLAGRSDLFGAWVTVASLGVSLGIIKILELPQEDLRDALAHEDVDIRIKAFDLVSASKDQIGETVLELVKEGFKWNDSLPSAGSRSAFSSSTYAFLVRLHQLETYTRRINRKKPNTESIRKEQASLAHILPVTESFHTWFLQYLDNGLTQARRFPVFKILLALNLLGRYIDVFGETEDTQRMVYTRDRVEMLLSCQMSEYTEVRNRSRKILESATIPLSGYETLSTPPSQALLRSALDSINLPRKTQAEAGKAALCILFTKLVIHPTDHDQAVRFVGNLIDKLEGAIEKVERDLVKGIEAYPLHGSLTAISDLLQCLDMTTAAAQQAWKPTLHRIFDVISRIWNITKTVISLAPSTVQGASDADRPEHEIARAYEVMATTGDEEDDGEGEEMDHTGLLSGCWRATRNAGELLATIVSLPITQSASQTIWSKENVDRAGQLFLIWMHEIRHRGTFSKIASAFAQLIDAVRPVPELRSLCDEWLQHELRTIASDQHSTTRRSAALPYSILSIVSSDEDLLNTALKALLDLASVDNDATSNVTKVHAFNVLKIVMLDARQTKWFSTWFERGVITALRAFESEDWNVRNVGLILFSTLVHRCLSPARGGQDLYKSRSTLSTRQSFSTFHSKYPDILPYITKYLEIHTEGENTHSPVFPILIIIRSLRYDDECETIVKGMRDVVERYLSNREYQIRQVAAQALSSMVSPAQAFDTAMNCTTEEGLGMNATHGRILYLQQLISNVIPWSDSAITSKANANADARFENKLLALVERFVPAHCPPITQAVLKCVDDYRINVDNAFDTSQLVESTKQLAIKSLDAQGVSALVPGQDARQIAIIKFLLTNQPEEDLMLSLLAKSSTEIQSTLALEHLPQLPDLWTQQVFDAVLDLALSGRGGQSTQVFALDALSQISWPRNAIDALNMGRKDAIGRLEKLVGVRCVPVKEAALVALGWAINQSINNHDASVDLRSYANVILSFSHEDESQPSRYAALTSLTQLASSLFTASRVNIDLHKSTLRLMQDDDEEIRAGTSDIIVKGLGHQRGLVHAKTLGMYWDWLEGYIRTLNPGLWSTSGDLEGWVEWLRDLSTDKKGLQHDLRVYKQEKNSIEVLFEVEPPNIFRDPLVDLFYSNKLLRDLGLELGSTSISQDAGMELGIVGEENDGQGLELSPIDDAWEARRTILRRKNYQEFNQDQESE
ncbi:uncharacterized protein I303_108554 [Kwoniella dejecticola CBS 10117]|uniref:Uncharacterized protein n=1 Tax=Kwoniella dejecticola CBS 10117 TaxID=1296121 RepID=A0A1A5ZX34_9TREE|nr:uncharacterized protein I303_07121 [Kwoniella dejecticola CBS 10117]OBR82362.1 hypothetical protein I303_07121 [Kwoniella dejecticola CBS 10117]